MDLREKKTKRSIKNAFLQLRAQKPLERITVKELVQLAEISKGTFYLHYRDIYDLSSQLQNEVIQDILNCVIQPNRSLRDIDQITHLLFESFLVHQEVVDILFSGNQATVLASHLEQNIKEYAFRLEPQLRDDLTFNVILSYQVYGAYYAYWENFKRFGSTSVVDVLDTFSIQIKKES